MGSRRVMKYCCAKFPNGNCWEAHMKAGLLAAVAGRGLFLAGPASAQGVKIGILNDQSGVYADYGGKGSAVAAKMPVDDFAGHRAGQKLEVTQTAPSDN